LVTLNQLPSCPVHTPFPSICHEYGLLCQAVSPGGGETNFNIICNPIISSTKVCNPQISSSSINYCVIITVSRDRIVGIATTSVAVRVHIQAEHVGLVVNRVALGQVFSEYFGFPCQSPFHQFLHHHNHLGLAHYVYWCMQC
jgi:hypothetical protein